MGSIRKLADEKPSLKVDGKLDDSGYVLTMAGATHDIKKATSGDPVLGIADKSTEDPLNEGEYLSAIDISVVTDGIATVQAVPGTIQGETLQVGTTDGVVSAGDPIVGQYVGIALSDESDGKVETELRL